MMLWADYMQTVSDAIASSPPSLASRPSVPCVRSDATGTLSVAHPATRSILESASHRGALVLTHFRDVVLASCLEMVVAADVLDQLLAQQPLDLIPQQQGGGAVTRDEYIGCLLEAGFLCRDHTRSDTAFMFCVPKQGAVFRHMLAGRQELIGWIGKRRYKEVKEAELMKLKLKGSKLAIPFHIQDLLGMGGVKHLHTTTGNVYKLTSAKGRS
jgi:hypothetical protein